ncbi:hypothetical protein [Clostridium formicaceticum]|uniref:Uncharacterized protein n=1 Tax=Clostridium formicaceticum TaxID=1497 RepID=A0AAC9RME9_9CLOT|nr:hypothetical protein [Clostridium formicaceticum]AOY77397.1 hypothetical protein BJL90_16985 [Clostridium formicaceticum]ARE87948.1 hypothetical protein CLFO_23480 [Clostridium formicaceticum]
MINILNLIYRNKEWLFSGFGIVFFTIIIKYFYSSIALYNFKKNSNLIRGFWRGKVYQIHEMGQSPIEFLITCKITNIKGKFRAESKIWIEDSHEKTEETMIATGQFVKERFVRERILKFDYFIGKNEIVQFGQMLLELHANGSELSGFFTGFGATSEKLLAGYIKIKKYDT